MTVVLNTLADEELACRLAEQLKKVHEDVEVFHTSRMKIAHCMGCNHCFLKTPGVCAIKDDYEQILKKLAHSDKMWLIADTHFGFVNANGKKVMDRLLPLLNMGLEFRDGQMRHTLRYDKLSMGLIYKGQADQQLLDFWCQRVSVNLGGESLGAHSSDKIEEVVTCM